MNKKVALLNYVYFLLLSSISMTAYGQEQPEKNNTENFFFFCEPTIQFWDIDNDLIEYAAPAQWTEILVSQDCPPSTLVNLDENFNEDELQNFRVLLEDSGIAEDEIFVTLRSLSEGGAELDRITSLRLEQDNTSDDRFISDYLLVVIDNDEIDDDFEESSGVNPLWDGTDDGEDDVSIYGEIGGKLEATLLPNTSNLEAEGEVFVCPPEQIRTVTVNVHVLKNPTNGLPFVESEIIDAQLDMAKRVLSQACIKLDVNTTYNNFDSNLTTEEVLNGIEISDLLETEEVKSIIGQVKDTDNQRKIDLIFLNEFEDDEMTNGISLNDFLFSPGFPYDGNENHKRTCLISGNNLTAPGIRPFLVGHEMGHVLSNNTHYLAESYGVNIEGCVNIVNLGYPDPEFTDLNIYPNPNNTLLFNLMRSGTSLGNEFFASKRLRSFQINLFRTQTDIPKLP